MTSITAPQGLAALPLIGFVARDIGRDVHGSALKFGGLHLARNGAEPDQLIKLCLIGFQLTRQILRLARQVRRANRFVRFLRVLGFILVHAR